MKTLRSNKGFTLIELVVVIAILGILAGIAIPRFMDATATARGAKIVADLRTIDSAIMLYQAKTGSLPTSLDNLTNANQSSAYLATKPVPPTGTAKITLQSGTNAGKTATITAASPNEYGFSPTDGRATYGGNDVDKLLAGTGTTNPQ